MANNYTSGAAFLPIKKDQIHLVPDIIDRVNRELEEDDADYFFDAVIEVHTDGVYFRHDENIDPDYVASIAKQIVEDLKINEPFYMSWAYTCSKARVDEFGGGALVVRRGNDTQWVDAMSYIQALPYIKPPTVVEHTEEST